MGVAPGRGDGWVSREPSRFPARRFRALGVSPMSRFIAQLAAAHDEDGQGLAEYALILALIAIVAIVALIFLGGEISKIISNVGNSM